MGRHLRHYPYIFFLVILAIGISLYTSSSFAKPDLLESPDGRYKAVRISSSGGVHYQVQETSTGRIVLTTHAQYKEANDVKAGLFGPNSQTFAAAYHYGHKGSYTWIGVWTIGTRFLSRREEKPGFLKDLSGIFRSPPSSAIKSLDGKYEARRVVSGGSVHYELREHTTGRKVIITRSQYNTPNDVKAGAFSSDSKEFAAAYHYGHKGSYTWIGIWTISTGTFRELTKPGFSRSISTSIFAERPKPEPKEKTTTIYGYKQAPYTGNIYYIAKAQIPRTSLITVTNPNLGLGKQWIVQIIPAGVSSEDCGKPGKTINIHPGSSTTELKGASLYNFVLGFCLSTTDNFTWSQGLPPQWGLKIKYKQE